MSTVLFLSGVGVGALASTLLFIAVLGFFTQKNKRTEQAAASFNETTAELMRERNELDRQKIAVMRDIEARLAQRL